MPRQPDHYYRPQNLDEALNLLQRPNTAPLSGGAQLLATEAGPPYDGLVDLQDVGLDTVAYDEDGRLTVGSMVRLADLAEGLSQHAGDEGPRDLLLQAIQYSGPNTYRNMATVGGTVAGRLPDSEWLAALLVLETRLVLRLPQEEVVNLTSWMAADQRPPGLITSIDIGWTKGRGHSERVARTPKDYPIVSITGWIPEDGRPRLATTGLGDRPFRLTAADTAVADGLDEPAIEEAAAAARAAAYHPGDFRGDAAYRAEMAAVLTRRVLRQLAGESS